MADKKKILFWPDVYKEQGHWLPTLAWKASSLASRRSLKT
jgi:hypothetical protein